MRTRQSYAERRAANKAAVDAIRNRKWLAGVCRYCDQPRKPTSALCQTCTDKDSARITTARRAKRAMLDSATKPPDAEDA